MLTNPADKKFIGPEVVYFQGNTTALGTTRSAYPAAVALAVMNKLGIPGLKKLAQECVKHAQWVAKKLEKVGLSMIAPVNSGVVPIALNSEREAEQVRTQLLKNGFKVSSINVGSGDDKIVGMRIVVTPNPLRKLSNLEMFTEVLIDTYRRR